MPCSADSALRRSIPAFNKDVREVQTRLEDVAFKLRIPQRKPWVPMSDDVRSASSIVAQPERVSPAVGLSIDTLTHQHAGVCTAEKCQSMQS